MTIKRLIPIAVCAAVAFVATNVAHAKSQNANANAANGQAQGNATNPPPQNDWQGSTPGWDNEKGNKKGFNGYPFPPGFDKNGGAPFRVGHKRFPASP